MSVSTLSNIDELVFKTRDSVSKKLIREAVGAYQGGAFRAAILSTWVAVAYDIISKIRELASQGDAAAIVFETTLTNAITNNNLRSLQTIENNLLHEASQTFQFLAPHQLENLERLRKDRHMCAHPAFVSDDELFQPTAELTRTHIVHSLHDLLEHAPLQGKVAMERLRVDILSPAYPVTPDLIRTFVKGRYIDSARDSLVALMIKGLISCPLGDTSAEYVGKERQIVDTIIALANLKPQIFDAVAPDFVKKKASEANDPKLLSFIKLAAADPRIWEWIGPEDRVRIQTLVEGAQPETIKAYEIFDAFEIDDLKPVVEAKFLGIGPDWQQSIIAERPRGVFKDYVADLYARARSFRQAEVIGASVVEPMVPFLDGANILAVIAAARENGQIYQANLTPSILEDVYAGTKAFLPQTGAAWRAFVAERLPTNPSWAALDALLTADGF